MNRYALKLIGLSLIAWSASTSTFAAAAKTPAAVDAKRLIAADSEPGNWMSHGRTYSEQRFSPLEQINDTNVSRLGLAWAHKFDDERGVETTPIVVDGVMYTSGPWSKVVALNAKTGAVLWMLIPRWKRSSLPKVVAMWPTVAWQFGKVVYSSAAMTDG